MRDEHIVGKRPQQRQRQFIARRFAVIQAEKIREKHGLPVLYQTPAAVAPAGPPHRAPAQLPREPGHIPIRQHQRPQIHIFRQMLSLTGPHMQTGTELRPAAGLAHLAINRGAHTAKTPWNATNDERAMHDTMKTAHSAAR